MRKDRLIKLAEHLEAGCPGGHKIFDFNRYNSSSKPLCGTKGCAIGECPIIWSDEWCFNCDGEPRPIDEFASRRGFFDLPCPDYEYLFIPGYGLPKDATREQVAKNIRKFVASH